MGVIVSLAELQRHGRPGRRPPSPSAHATWDAHVRDLVWLTINPLPRDSWLRAGEEYLGDVIVTVEPGAEAWTSFARLRGYPERYLKELQALGNPSEWFVSTKPIASGRWLRVQEGRSGHVLWERGTPLADALILCIDCKVALRRPEAVELDDVRPLCADCAERRAAAPEPAPASRPEPPVRNRT